MRRGQLISSREARPAKKQHTTPCADCPWARKALPGWLGGDSVQDWIAAAHAENRISCHTLTGAQCAGAAIYRANVVKSCRDRTNLALPADKVRVFASAAEFAAHHEGGLQLLTQEKPK